jgi:hypothetical protein
VRRQLPIEVAQGLVESRREGQASRFGVFTRTVRRCIRGIGKRGAKRGVHLRIVTEAEDALDCGDVAG